MLVSLASTPAFFHHSLCQPVVLFAPLVPLRPFDPFLSIKSSLFDLSMTYSFSVLALFSPYIFSPLLPHTFPFSLSPAPLAHYFLSHLRPLDRSPPALLHAWPHLADAGVRCRQVRSIQPSTPEHLIRICFL